MPHTEWMRVKSGQFHVSAEHFHYNANILVDRYSEQTQVIRKALSHRLSVVPTIRRTRGAERPGIHAGSLNNRIRESLKGADNLGIRLECAEKGGYFLSDGSIGGFDFAYIDEQYNTIAYRNRCRGPVCFHDGELRWGDAPQLGIHALEATHPVYTTPRGELVEGLRSSPAVLGEIQFGNWALLYYDLFKALSALESGTLDLFVYICPSGRLRDLLSDGIVTYEDSVTEIRARAHVLRFPIWIIGLDVHGFEQ